MFISADDERILEFNRIMEWINANKDTWENVIGIISNDFDADDENHVKILKELREQKFYQIILILFHTSDYLMGEAVERATFGVLSKRINKRSLDDFIEKVIDNLEKIRNE